MFAFANVFHFLADKFARLSGGRFAFELILTGLFDCFFFRHIWMHRWAGRLRMPCLTKQAVNEADLVNEERIEAKAEPAGHGADPRVAACDPVSLEKGSSGGRWNVSGSISQGRFPLGRRR